MKQIYLFNIVAWSYRKKIGFPVCKKKIFHRPSSVPEARKERSCQSYSASDIERRFTAQPLSALPWLISLRDRSSNFPFRAPATDGGYDAFAFAFVTDRSPIVGNTKI